MTLRDLIPRVEHDKWTERAIALADIGEALRAGLDAEQEQALLPAVVGCTRDSKWEVRKAAAVTLPAFRHVPRGSLRKAIQALLDDRNRWVRRAAQTALQRTRVKTDAWSLASASPDPTLSLITKRIREIGLRAMTPASILELASEVGELYYRDLAADTAHEIRTLLTPIEGHLGVLEKRVAEPEKIHVVKALARVRLLAALVEDLRTYSSPDDGPTRNIDLARVVRDALAIASAGDSVEVQTTIPTGLIVDARLDRLIRAFANIISNACQAMPSGGELTIDACGRMDSVVVSISDTGPGMTSDGVEEAERRFASSRRHDGGTGLGLPIAKQIVAQHGGELAIESVEGVGTTVVITLPCAGVDHE